MFMKNITELWVRSMLIYNRHLEALYSNSTLSCFITTAKTTFVCAPYEKSDNRAPKRTPQQFRSALLGSVWLQCVISRV